MSRQKKKDEIIELIQTNGENLDFFYSPFGEIPENLTKEQLRERYFKPEYWDTLELHQMSVSELKHKLSELNKIREAAGLGEISS
jgi:hypothetical protein